MTVVVFQPSIVTCLALLLAKQIDFELILATYYNSERVIQCSFGAWVDESLLTCLAVLNAMSTS